jgi:hypothetical protein
VADSSQPPAEIGPDQVEEAGQANAAAALHAAFARLAPQGSNPWNFMAAFTRLADQYGPDHPGASAMADVLKEPLPPPPIPTRLDRVRRLKDVTGPPNTKRTDDLEEALGHVIEAFRFLNARIRTLEAQSELSERPIDGAAWLAPASELGGWTALVCQHISEATPAGAVLHADCGDGSLLTALRNGGLEAFGVEPRGMVALQPLEQGHQVTIAEVTDVLPSCSTRSLGGLVLSGVVDRVPVHVLVSMLAQAERSLSAGAPIVVIATDPAAARAAWSDTTSDLVEARPLHATTWESLLAQAGFANIGYLHGPDGDATRVGVRATVAR